MFTAYQPMLTPPSTITIHLITSARYLPDRSKSLQVSLCLNNGPRAYQEEQSIPNRHQHHALRNPYDNEIPCQDPYSLAFSTGSYYGHHCLAKTSSD